MMLTNSLDAGADGRAVEDLRERHEPAGGDDEADGAEGEPEREEAALDEAAALVLVVRRADGVDEVRMPLDAAHRAVAKPTAMPTPRPPGEALMIDSSWTARGCGPRWARPATGP